MFKNRTQNMTSRQSSLLDSNYSDSQKTSCLDVFRANNLMTVDGFLCMVFFFCDGQFCFFRFESGSGGYVAHAMDFSTILPNMVPIAVVFFY